MLIGNNPDDPVRYWDGLIDELKIYDRALSEGEVMYLAGLRTYTYGGDVAVAGPNDSWDSLDGTWDHSNSSDAWDGSIIGEGSPGGAMTLTEGSVTFLRVQEPGNPTKYGFSDPSNRKMFFGHQFDHNLDFVKLEFRARLATTAPLDDLNPSDGSGVVPWPEGGDGNVIQDRGKGMIGVGEAEGGGMISFALAKAAELAPVAGFEDVTTDALVMNNLVGTEMSEEVDTGDTGGVLAVNYVAIEDAAQWNTFAITITAGGTGTHVVTVSVNGGPEQIFDVTIGADNDVPGNYIGIGSSGTGASTAFDIDYVTVSNY